MARLKQKWLELTVVDSTSLTSDGSLYVRLADETGPSVLYKDTIENGPVRTTGTVASASKSGEVVFNKGIKCASSKNYYKWIKK